VKTLQNFVSARDWHPGAALDSADLAPALRAPARQLSLF
jgi:hypothetical protein